MTVGTCSCGVVFRDDNPLNQPKDTMLLHSQAGHSIQLWNQGCGRKLGPFDCCTVVCGDCLELMKQLPDGCVDAVITDPPYGMGLDTNYSGIDRGCGKEYPRIMGDDRPFDPRPFLAVGRVRILWGAQYFATSLPPNGGWLVFNKRGNGEPSAICFGDCEIAWTDIDRQSVRMYSEQWHGYPRVREGAHHPSQKSIGLMQWCIEQAGMPETILDPFLGSGTTAVAAKKLGRHFLGFEISPEYCEIARKRIALVEAQPTLFEKKPEQLNLGGTE